MSDETSTGATPPASEAPSSPAPAETPAPELSDAQRQDANRRLMDRLVRTGRKDDGQPSAPAPAEASRQPAPRTEPEADFVPPKTRAEYERGIQAEVDRRAAKAQRDAEAKAKKDQERWELDNDQPAVIERRRQELAQEDQQAQQAQVASAFTADLQAKYDRAVLDPLFLELPEATQQSILKSNPFQGDTLKQRQDITKATLAALKKQYKAEGAREAETKLRANPALIKQQLVDLRDETDEPVTVSGAASNGHAPNMNDFIRAGVGKRIR